PTVCYTQTRCYCVYGWLARGVEMHYDALGQHQRELDDSVPLPARQATLREQSQANISHGRPPYAGVKVLTRGEVLWIMGEHGWTGDALGPNQTHADLRGTDFRGAVLRGVYLRGANLEGATFSAMSPGGATLWNLLREVPAVKSGGITAADLDRADLSVVDVDPADLQGAHLDSANLRHAVLFQVDLSAAGLSGADLARAILREANLAHTNLVLANLERADLRWANVMGA